MSSQNNDFSLYLFNCQSWFKSYLTEVHSLYKAVYSFSALKRIKHIYETLCHRRELHELDQVHVATGNRRICFSIWKNEEFFFGNSLFKTHIILVLMITCMATHNLLHNPPGQYNETCCATTKIATVIAT